MKRMILCLVALVFLASPKISIGANANLAWDAPTTNIDGSKVTDLAGFKVYHGLSSGNYDDVVDVGNVLTYLMEGLKDGTHYFTVTAYDTSGNESLHSNEVNKLTKDIMNAPFLHEVVVTIKNGEIINVVIQKIGGENAD